MPTVLKKAATFYLKKQLGKPVQVLIINAWGKIVQSAQLDGVTEGIYRVDLHGDVSGAYRAEGSGGDVAVGGGAA